MAEGRLTIAEIVNQLPQKLQSRFESLGSYVRGVIQEERERLERDITVDTEDIQFIQLAALIYLLDSFMRTGTVAARNASSIFEQFGLAGFEIGSSRFTQSNENTLRGERLAQNLRSVIAATSLNRFITNSSSMRDLVIRLLNEIKDAETLDQ